MCIVSGRIMEWRPRTVSDSLFTKSRLCSPSALSPQHTVPDHQNPKGTLQEVGMEMRCTLLSPRRRQMAVSPKNKCPLAFPNATEVSEAPRYCPLPVCTWALLFGSRVLVLFPTHSVSSASGNRVPGHQPQGAAREEEPPLLLGLRCTSCLEPSLHLASQNDWCLLSRDLSELWPDKQTCFWPPLQQATQGSSLDHQLIFSSLVLFGNVGFVYLIPFLYCSGLCFDFFVSDFFWSIVDIIVLDIQHCDSTFIYIIKCIPLYVYLVVFSKGAQIYLLCRG